MGYIFLVVLVILLVPIIYLVMARRPGPRSEGERPIGKPVMVEKPAADEPTPAASDTRQDTQAAQRRTPPA